MIDPTREISSLCNLMCAMLGVVEDIFPPVHIRRQLANSKIDKVGSSGCDHLGDTRLAGCRKTVARARRKASGKHLGDNLVKSEIHHRLNSSAGNQLFHRWAACPGRMETDHLVAHFLKQPRRLGHPIGHSHLRQADDQLVPGA